MGIIHVLDARVSNQIAAGEVIERPSSAVKELIENALDAHAENVSIEIAGGGVDLIKVTDDGDGFYKDDLPLAIERHATSKIENFNDVYHLDTFGFRGEALASIAVISRLRITSGRSDDVPASVMSSEASGEVSFTVAAPRKGTCIEVRDLYYNVPARKKFVRSNSHESALIYDLVCKFALGFPTVNFTYQNDGEVVFSSNQLTSVGQILNYIYGEVTEGEIIHFKDEAFFQQQSVEGWFFPPTVTRKNRNHMTYFVNGRLIESKELDQVIEEAVYTLVPKGRFLVCVLKLELPAFNIDVNIHPSKKVIKFKNIDEWKASLISLIKEELWLSRLNVPYPVQETSSASFELQQQVHDPVEPQRLDFSAGSGSDQQLSGWKADEPAIDHPIKSEWQPADVDGVERSEIAESETGYGQTKMQTSSDQGQPLHPSVSDNMDAKIAVEKKDMLLGSAQTALTQQDLTDLEYIGQLNQTFILAQDRDNLYIIDQHTLHERILYEKFMAEYDRQHITKQPLLHPVRISVSPLQEEALVRHIMTLDRLGFLVEKKGPLQYDLRTVPVLLSQNDDLAVLFLDMLDDLDGKDGFRGLSEINEERIIMASCKAAVKAHYKLTESEVRYLFSELSTLKNAHTCPHGRPIIMNISMNALYLFFKRGSF